MYRPDVAQLRQFYSSPLGQHARACISHTIRRIWPELHQDVLLGLGYANPFLRHYLKEEKSNELLLLPIMAAAQGAIYWPQHKANRTVLAHESSLPLGPNMVNRILMVHTLEHVKDEEALLQECWRVLTPGGRMLVVVPHRRSIWSSSPNTPFSYGHPYSISHLKRTLTEHRFTHIDTMTDLFFLPSTARGIRKLIPLMQWAGRHILPGLGGVIVMEVEKQIYASVKQPAKPLLSQPVYVPVGKPAMTRQ